jgi:endoglucanase
MKPILLAALLLAVIPGRSARCQSPETEPESSAGIVPDPGPPPRNPELYYAAEKADFFVGIRSVVPIRPDLLAVTVDGAIAKSGAGLNNDLLGPLQKPESFSLQCGGGEVFHPTAVGRQSTEIWRGPVGGVEDATFYLHTFYLKLPRALKPDETCSITIPAIPKRFTQTVDFTFSPERTKTPAIKVNQVAYSRLASERYAYLGWWAGDLGPVDFSDMKTFEVIDEASGKSVMSGEIRARAEADPASGEAVAEMAIEKLPPGKYHIAIPGFARSDSFGVGLVAGVKNLYYDTARAFFHQRAGTELSPDQTDYPRLLAHRATYESGYGTDNPAYTPKPGEESREFRGGHHRGSTDEVLAGDLRATALPLVICEALPDAFRDKDLKIPESGNRIPDMLDEAAWGLSFFTDSQQADGAIMSGRGNDAPIIQEIEKQTGRRPAFGLLEPTVHSSLEYAAVAARLTRLLRPHDPARADCLTSSAKSAYEWASARSAAAQPDDESNILRAWAAAELFNTTGTAEFNTDFLALYHAGALKKFPGPSNWLPDLARWTYASSKQPAADSAVKKDLADSITRGADSDAVAARAGIYRVLRGTDPVPGSSGGGGRPAIRSMLAHLLSGDPKYLTTASLNADFQLGANPLSKTFLTGLGARHPNQPQLGNALFSAPNRTGNAAPGITVFGPAVPSVGGLVASPGWYPDKVPHDRHYVDIGNGAEPMSGFSISETVGPSAMLYQFLYATEKQSAKKR